MSIVAWIVTIVWPVAVVFGYSFIVDDTLAERAKVISEKFNMTGRALNLVNEDLEKIKTKIGIGDSL